MTVRSSDWQAYRDPAQLWQRPYVAMCSVEEQALDHLSSALLSRPDRVQTNLRRLAQLLEDSSDSKRRTEASSDYPPRPQA